MGYESLFEELSLKGPLNHYSNEYQEYDGTLSSVLKELGQVIAGPARFYDKLMPQDSYLVRMIFHPPRVIRAVVDYNIENPQLTIPLELFQRTFDFALSCYQENKFESEDLLSQMEYLKDKLYWFDHQILSQSVKQIADIATMEASKPKLSEDSAYEILEKTLGEDLFFIALGHGGVAAGMDVYLRYLSISGSDDSQFYVTRLSTDKHQDEHPRLRKEEIEALQPLAEKKQIVIFDEDVATGKTMMGAYDFFTRVFPDREILLQTNYNTSSTYPDLEEIIAVHRSLNTNSDL